MGEIGNASWLAGARQNGICTTRLLQVQHGPDVVEESHFTPSIVRKKRLPAGAGEKWGLHHLVCYEYGKKRKAEGKMGLYYDIIIIILGRNRFFFVVVGGVPHPSGFIQKPHFFLSDTVGVKPAAFGSGVGQVGSRVCWAGCWLWTAPACAALSGADR